MCIVRYGEAGCDKSGKVRTVRCGIVSVRYGVRSRVLQSTVKCGFARHSMRLGDPFAGGGGMWEGGGSHFGHPNITSSLYVSWSISFVLPNYESYFE